MTFRQICLISLISLIPHFNAPAALAQTPTPSPTPVPIIFGNDPVTGDFVIREKGVGGTIKMRINSSGYLDAPVMGSGSGGGGANLVLNPGFEYPTTSTGTSGGFIAYNWWKDYHYITGNIGATETNTDTAFVQEGQKSIKITNATSAQGTAIASDPFSISGGTTYTVSVDVKESAVMSTGLYVRVFYFAADETQWGSNTSGFFPGPALINPGAFTYVTLTGADNTGFSDTASWHTVSADIVAPAGATACKGGTAKCTNARIVLYHWGVAGTRYFDRVVFKEKSLGSTVPASSVTSGLFAAGNFAFQGNVGIGTNTPAAKLDIAGTTSFIKNTSGDLSIKTAGNLLVTNSAGTTEYMRVTSAGNVGIGTTSPGAKLDVQGNMILGPDYAISPRYTSNDTYRGNFQWQGIQFGNNSQNVIAAGNTATGGYLDFVVNNSADLASNPAGYNGEIALTLQADGDVIMNGGNVGIGTTGPGAKLEVAGGDTYLQTTSIGQSGSHYQEIGYNVGFTGTNDTYTYRGTDTAASMRMGYDGFEFRTAGSGTAGSALTLSEKVRITSAGNVGIGTTGPTTKLDVAGVITATSGNSTNWNTAYTHSQDVSGAVHGATSAVSGNMIVRRDVNGYIFGNYFNSTDDVSAGTLTYLMGKFGDNYYRSATAAKVASFISGQSMNISGNATTATALAANGANCSSGQYPSGVDASGAVESCTAATQCVQRSRSNGTGESHTGNEICGWTSETCIVFWPAGDAKASRCTAADACWSGGGTCYAMCCK